MLEKKEKKRDKPGLPFYLHSASAVVLSSGLDSVLCFAPLELTINLNCSIG